MKEIIVDNEIKLIPYYPNEKITLEWYQDLDVCKQVDNVDYPYSIEKLNKMYHYLNTHGELYYIEYQGVLVGDITLKDNGEICIVICKEYQNRHIGRKCIVKMIEIAKEKGLEKVFAEIYPFNTQSIKTFEAIGFVKIDDETYEFIL
ncbi:MAG: GNAT family N-acetyltransferase [Clostridia bacterium]|nr:GNAT family N-acetyltransferase [Clostridia bacterium]